MSAALHGFKSIPLSLSQLSIATVLKCGQSFRWHKIEAPDASESLEATEWRLALADRVVCLRQTPDALYYRAVYTAASGPLGFETDASTLAWIRDYFQLDVDLVEVFAAVKDPVFQEAASRFQGGIRMLRQDPWENLISFICSQNNHISRITSMVQNLCTHFSPSPILVPSLTQSSVVLPYYPFPPPQALADLSVDATLRGLGFGYRAKYIQKTAAMLCESHADPSAWLLSLRTMPTEQAREELVKLAGVGPKVADCILLMSLDKKEVVPIDTHMLQIAIKHYNVKIPGYSSRSPSLPPMTPKLHADISAKFRAIWGPYAGWAHSVLFTADLRQFADAGSPKRPGSKVKNELEPEEDGVLDGPIKTEVEAPTCLRKRPHPPSTPSENPLPSPPPKKKRAIKRTTSGVQASTKPDRLPVVDKKESTPSSQAARPASTGARWSSRLSGRSQPS